MIGSYFSNGAFVGAKSKARKQLHRIPSGVFFSLGITYCFLLYFNFAATANGGLRRNRLTFLDLLASHRTGRRHGPQIDPGRPILLNGLIGAKKIHFYFARKSSLVPLKDHYTPWPHGPIRPELFS